MSNLKLVKIGLYARVSSEKQAQEKTIESQIAGIIDYANTMKEKIDADLHFIDNGVSGAYLERPGLDKLRDKAIAGEVSKVYVLSPDRLSRKGAHQILLVEEMKRLGVTFSFANRQIGETPEDQMLLQIQGIISEYEREKILERARRGKLYAAKCGKIRVLSGAPYGYFYKKAVNMQDAMYVIHPDEAAVVKEAFTLYCYENFSINGIAKHFTNRGYSTRSGATKWNRSVIWGMLSNPAYKGAAAYRKTKRIDSKIKTKHRLTNKRTTNIGASSIIRQEGDWLYIQVPAIITEEDFGIAQQKLKVNRQFSPRNNKKNNYLLTGLLRCTLCSYAIYGKATSKDNQRIYYRCSGLDSRNATLGGRKICSGHPIRAEVLEDLVWGAIKELLLIPEIIVTEYQRRVESTQQTDYEYLISQKYQEIRRYNRERERLIDLFQTGLIEKVEIEAKLQNLRSKIEQLNNEILYLDNQDKESKKLLTVIHNLNDFSLKMNQNLDLLSFEEKKKMIRCFVESVEVDSIQETINVKHIIPLDSKKWRLCSGRLRRGMTWTTPREDVD
jgi:site-specific DNA recombinase